MIFNFFIKNTLESFVDNVFRDKVYPIRGSVVYCDLGFGLAEHSGIYVGDNKIVHLDGSGLIECVSPRMFISRLNGLNGAISIYVSCVGGSAVGANNVAKRAVGMIGEARAYNVVLDNCHQFSSGCITGNFDNSDNFLWMLKKTSRERIGSDTWRVWETSDGQY
jgi:hypothetical protein